MATTTPKNPKSTLDIYEQLIQVELRANVKRIGELTSTVDHLLVEVGSIALRIEEAVSGIDKMSSRVKFVRSEFDLLKKKINLQESNINALHQRIAQIESSPQKDVDRLFGELLRVEAEVRKMKKQLAGTSSE